MKRKQKLLIASTAAAAAVMLAAGVTLAVMATDTTTSWTINTPELKLRAKAANVKVWSASSVDNVGNETYVQSDLLLGENKIGFTHGGGVTYNDNSVTIDGILPGDKVEFDIEVTSISTVAFDYRAELYVDATNGQTLKNQLDYSFTGMGHLRLDDSVNTNNSDKLKPAVLSDYTEWKTISARQEAVENVHVTISLPYAADKGQGESLTLSYVVGAIQHAQEQSDVAEVTYQDGTTKKFNTLGEAVADAQVNGISEVKVIDSATRPEDTITVSNFMKFTGEGDKPQIMGARFIVNRGAAVEFKNVSFAGDSYVDISDGSALTITDCNVDVNSVKYFDTYTRTFLKDSAFVVSGSSLTPARLTLENNTFKSNAGAAVNMRSLLREGTAITNNHFGTAESAFDGDAVLSLYGAESDVTINFENNEIFGKLAMSFDGATQRFKVVSTSNTLVSSGNTFVGGNAPAAFMDSGSKINSQNLECGNLDCASLLFGAVDVTFDKEITDKIAAAKVTLSGDMQVSDFYINFTAASRLATNVIGLYKDGTLYAYLNSAANGGYEVVPVEG